MSTSDIRKELEERMSAVQREIETLKREKEIIDAKVEDADSKLKALRRVYEIEAERLGVTSLPLWRDRQYRFAGMKLTEALALLQKERPGINKKQAHEILVKEGFDFRTGRTRTAVHAAWTTLERRKK